MDQHKLPHNISEYIREHFRGSLLSEVKEHHDSHGRRLYDVELSHEDLIYQLRFDEKGVLINKTMEESFPDEDSVVDWTASD
jgi:hypothetical protein